MGLLMPGLKENKVISHSTVSAKTDYETCSVDLITIFKTAFLSMLGIVF
jgi:hypothetical protein